MNIQEFKSTFTNFQRSNLYKVDFSFKNFMPSENVNMKAVSILCRDAAFPFFTFNLADVFYNGVKRSTAQQVDYDPVELTFMLDTNGNVMNFFKEWTNTIEDGGHNFGFRDDYIGEVVISMLDTTTSPLINTVSSFGSEGQVVANSLKKYSGYASGLTSKIDDLVNSDEFVVSKVKLVGAFPVNINEVGLSYKNNDQISTLAVSLNYDYADYGMNTKSKSLLSINKLVEYKNSAMNLVNGGLTRPNLDKVLSYF